MSLTSLTFDVFWWHQRQQAEAYDGYADEHHRRVVLNLVRHEGAMRQIYKAFPPRVWAWANDEPLRLERDRPHVWSHRPD